MSCEQNYLHYSTLICATQDNCVPCQYKLFPNGKVNDETRLSPNQRPENCPRAKQIPLTEYRDKCLYRKKQRILTLGDGDFSFSLSLAIILQKRIHSKKLVLIASSFESYEVVCQVYPTAADCIKKLKELNVYVLHGVDATNIDRKSFSNLNQITFDTIIWNFPCVRANGGADGQSSEITENQKLLNLFFQNIHNYLSTESEIHITHKTIEPFSWWGLQDIAQTNRFKCAFSIAFDRCLYPGYINRKALDKKSFPSFDAKTFVFISEDYNQPNLKDGCSTIAENKKLLFRMHDKIAWQLIEKHLIQGKETKKNPNNLENVFKDEECEKKKKRKRII